MRRSASPHSARPHRGTPSRTCATADGAPGRRTGGGHPGSPGCHAKNSLRGQWMSRSPSALNRTSGRSWVNTKNSSGSIRANRAAGRSRTRWRKAPVAARPASIHPPNAMTRVVRFAGGSRSNSTLSMLILSAVASVAPPGVLRLRSSAWRQMASTAARGSSRTCPACGGSRRPRRSSRDSSRFPDVVEPAAAPGCRASR